MIARTLRLACLAIAMVCMASSQAAEWLRYTFNDGVAANDITGVDANNNSLGTIVVPDYASGGVVNPNLTFVDPTGIGQIAGGYADLTNNNGRNSNQDWIAGTPSGAFMELGDFSFSDAAFLGTPGAVSIEMWVIVEENRNWARLWDIGSSDAGNNISTGGGSSNYVIGVAQSSRENNPFEASTHSVVGPGDPEVREEFYTRQPAGPLALAVEHHVVMTFDQSNTMGGANPNGTATLYLNGAQVAQGPVHNGNNGASPIDLGNLNDENGWFGRAQWGDPLFDGLYNEIRIHDSALTLSDVQNSSAAGPVDVSLPVVTIDRTTGDVAVANASGATISLTGYTLTSNAGTLNTAGFQSIAGDAGGTWSQDALTTTEIGQTNNAGSNFADGADAGLGSAWTKSSIEDIEAVITLLDGTETGALVSYVGDAFSPLDLDTDGDVDVADWLEFAGNAYTDLNGLSAVELALAGDLNGDGVNNFTDFLNFRTQFNAMAGAGAFEAMLASVGTQVPEPSTLLMLSLAGVAMIAIRKGRN